MTEAMDWGDVAAVERVIRAGFAPRTLDDIKISIGPGPDPGALEILAEEAAVPDVLQALAAAGCPYLGRLRPVDERRRELARTAEPHSLAAADGILSIVISHPTPDVDTIRAAIDSLSRAAVLGVDQFRSGNRTHLSACTDVHRDWLITRFVVAFLLTGGLVVLPQGVTEGWLPLELDEPYASEMSQKVLDAVRLSTEADVAAGMSGPEPTPAEIVASEEFARRRQAVQLDDRALSVARRTVEDVLVALRDTGNSAIPIPGNGFVIRAAEDGRRSSVIRLSTAEGLEIGIRAYLAALQALETKEG